MTAKNHQTQAPSTPQRTTRSSSLSKTPPKTLTPPSSDPLPHPIQRSSIDPLSAFPGRKPQTLRLLRLLSPPHPPFPLFLYGPHSTGKTSVALRCFVHLRLPFVYVSLRTSHSPRTLFESVLRQLGRVERRCERGASDFVASLAEALKLKADGGMVYLVFDNLELARQDLVSVLFRLSDLVVAPERLGLVFISSVGPDSYYLNTGSVEPIPVFFSDYTDEEIYRIFSSKNQASNPKLYSSFLDVMLKPFCRITRRINDLSVVLPPLFKKYCEPLSDMGVIPDGDMKRRLFNNIQPHLVASLNQVFYVPSYHMNDCNKERGSMKRSSKKLGSNDASDVMEFHMSVSTKYLLISAFLASRNPPTLDASLFDSTGGGDNRKRKRKVSATAMERKDNEVEELLMKGPGSFPLERLLAIFQCITSVAEGTLEEEGQEEELAIGDGDGGLMSDVLLQISVLCNANFLSKSGSCPLEGSTRYRSTVDEEMALKVARSINFPLSKYIYRR
ncbi:hypothetical protein QJS04_geneDACA002540 [Acorus gramineus]|uniref:Origin recognition complex subunit 5 n=1 Tax=Acorus gramineus TaxID=55184 RepID=A0AAV9AQY1_ACOGR|nr:hypothetical protein QJS04_geneDACA002540 [Acorus gramineus]